MNTNKCQKWFIKSVRSKTKYFIDKSLDVDYVLASDVRLVGRFRKSIGATEGTVETRCGGNAAAMTWRSLGRSAASPDPLSIRLKV